MIEIITNPIESEFIKAVAWSKRRILLCAPFIKRDETSKLLKEKQSDVDLVVFTNAYIPHYISQSSDISAVEDMINSGATVYSYDNLHAKVYMFDDEKAIITSGNLTHNGLNRNFEYGVLFDDRNLLAKIESDFRDAASKRSVCRKITDFEIGKMKKIIDRNKTARVYIDSSGDSLFEMADMRETIDLIMEKPGWKRDVLEIIFSIPTTEFTLADVNAYIDVLRAKYPDNNTIKDKIRQILQQLRDLELIKFESRGHYKKMFVTGR